MGVNHFYRSPALLPGARKVLWKKLNKQLVNSMLQDIKTEICFNVAVENEDYLSAEEQKKIQWILGTPFEECSLLSKSVIVEDGQEPDGLLIEIGPRLNFSTAWSTNAVSICQSAGINKVTRIERSIRYLINVADENGIRASISVEEERLLEAALHDRMTECRYTQPISNFKIQVKSEEVFEVDVLGQGKDALEKANKELGLAFDDWDLEFYTNMFVEKVKRNPTSVELFDLAQSNSEHSRHWFFKGRMVIDGEEKKNTLFQMVMATQETSNDNNVIKFSDNSSAIKGHKVKVLKPANPGSACVMEESEPFRHIIFTAETHNFPTGVAPFPGATTGTGGRIRDVQAAGKGAHVVAGTAGYCFGNLNIPGYDLPWEDKTFVYPSNMAPALSVAVEASNGASDYGNKFGEPVLTGFSRSFGMMVSDTERREWVKPIMFSGGIGMLESMHTTKEEAKKGMEIVKLGGPIYRIGVGGGAASSIQIQGDNTEQLDFEAVQRGDAEMEQKLNRVIRACIEMGEDNPICSIHDQGAGGNGNVLKEISEPAGAIIRAKEFQLGDPTINTLELWGAEYQESNAIIVKSEDRPKLQGICDREKCPAVFVGEITGDGKIRLEVEKKVEEVGEGDAEPPAKKRTALTYPVDLQLDWVLGKMPQKVFNYNRCKPNLSQLTLPKDLSIRDALDRVLRLPSVASKRYLTNKVDRAVTGLIAQQQCVGPLHTPLADVAVTAFSHFDTVGSATAIGEQPIKGLVDAHCGARMSVGEALTNLVFARISDLKDVKCSGNWMWPAKLPGEGAALYDACESMCEVMRKLGVAVDGGKDSLSMAARIGPDTVKAPGTLVVSVYVACPDIRATVTPDLKCPDGKGALLWVSFGQKHSRLGGSALAQCYNQLGDTSPDLDDAETFVRGFNTMQNLISEGKVLAGHDVSDGGIITTLLEMAFAGNCGIDVNISSETEVNAIDTLFAEELGLVLEVKPEISDEVCKQFSKNNVPCSVIGQSSRSGQVSMVVVSVDGKEVLKEKMTSLRDVWEETSFQLERLQANPKCVEEEQKNLANRTTPPFKLTFDPSVTDVKMVQNGTMEDGRKPKVAVIREEGSNGDREMASSLHMAGFETWDVNMQDLASGQITLDLFRGVVFVGGFSFADVCGSAKGWAATILFNPTVRAQFDTFRAREDTFSLGVCNGCQLMGLIGWVAPEVTKEAKNDANTDAASARQGLHLAHNISERFESRFVTVEIKPSPAMMLKGMEGSMLGVWVQHGEGHMKFANNETKDAVLSKNLAPARYVDDKGQVTTEYPLNPNGSPNGIAAVCSQDGRHLAIMPHPERTTLTWQWPWMPLEWRETLKVSPWLKMFQNACSWCLETSEADR
ncbi:phosphoribosylformylglycinamidine synthase-like [Anneissia japonica]|uniref:phosphoribosylformylglycinamidine synthase-like n=1 Tax=Anneissia japonica TaxID=1529436 RepID=UPI001425B6FA|nr:phosphoribosylformylglycinamidine synthase-like [Anneissia japonica]